MKTREQERAEDAERRKEQHRAHYLERLEASGVPEHLRSGLVLYLLERLATGSFLRACLENNLQEAVLRAASPETVAALPAIVRFLTSHAPGISWGNETLVAAWLSDPTPPRLGFD